MRASRFCFLLVLVGYPILIWCELTKIRPDEMLFAVLASSLFFVCYLLPFALFLAKVEVTNDGLMVEKSRRLLIGYSEISKCYGLFLIPFQVAVVITERKFPLKILIAGDSVKGPRKSIFQDGLLVSAIRAKITSRSSSARKRERK
jgi:hypothetical protein